LKLKNINFVFEDHYSGMRLKTHLDYFKTSLRQSDLLNEKYHAGNTELRGSYMEVNSFEPSMPPEPAEPGTPELDLSVNSISVQDISFIYKDTGGTNLSIDAGTLNLVPETISLPDYFIELASIGTENLAISIILPSGEKNEVERKGNETFVPYAEKETGFVFAEILEWTVKLGRIDIKNSFFSLREEAKELQTDMFDPGNFSLEGINFLAKDIFAGPERIDMNIDNMSMLISESFSLDKLSLDINLNSKSGKVRLDMLTNESSLGLSLEAEANLLNFLLEDLYDKSFDLYLTDNHINKDFAFFLPFMRDYYFNWPDNQGIEFGGRVHGSLEYVIVDSLRLAGPGFFTALFKGTVKGMPQTDSLYLDIENFSLYALPGPFFANLPDTLRPEGINLPEFIDAGGHFRGTFSEFESAMAISSNFGDVAIMVSMYDQPESENSFEGRIYTGSFDLGNLLQLDIITMPPSIELEFWGRGPDPASMELKTELVVGQLSVMEHSYEDIRLNLDLKDSVAIASASYSDDYLVIDLDAAIGIFTARAFGKGTVDLVFADLRQLGTLG
jgi:translocation and assembly module TamB